MHGSGASALATVAPFVLPSLWRAGARAILILVAAQVVEDELYYRKLRVEEGVDGVAPTRLEFDEAGFTSRAAVPPSRVWITLCDGRKVLVKG